MEGHKRKHPRTSSASEDRGAEDEDDRTFMARNFEAIHTRLETIEDNLATIEDNFATMREDINAIKGAIMPITPTICSPLKRLHVVSPTPQESCVVNSTWTMADLVGVNINVDGSSPGESWM